MTGEQPMKVDCISTPTPITKTHAPAAFRASTPTVDNAASRSILGERSEAWTENPNDNDDFVVLETEFLEREPRLREIIRILQKRVKRANREHRPEEANNWRKEVVRWERALVKERELWQNQTLYSTQTARRCNTLLQCLPTHRYIIIRKRSGLGIVGSVGSQR